MQLRARGLVGVVDKIIRSRAALLYFEKNKEKGLI